MSDFPAMPPFPSGEPGFIELLKRHVPFHPHWEPGVQAGEKELDPRRGVSVNFSFPDPEGLLETALSDLKRFFREAGIGEGPVKVEIRKSGTSMEREAFRITVSADAILIEAADTEGIRRGTYDLQDAIASGPVLSFGSREERFWLRNRLSRCFFGPIKRPPFNVDELMNDVDYYPEEYLSRLAHDGVNGLWLTIEFREICDTALRKAPPTAERRRAKLRRTVERCRRYGIRIWAFCIEPFNWQVGNPLPPGCEELAGPGYSAEEVGTEMRTFCINSPKAEQYLHDCTYSLFSEVPHLGGLLTISYGERPTSCLSMIPAESDGTIPCKRRCALGIGDVMARVLGAMRRGMLAANPDAQQISWLYMPHPVQTGHWITQIPEKLSGDLALAFNFESGISKCQLEKVRNGGDYWLSAVGPSDRFSLMASAVRGHCRFAAKMQVACSHECATVPYVPIPGQLYKKYRAMKECGVTDVIQCWYFGNYPGLMNEAAGALAREDFRSGEEAFLTALAKRHWGKDYRSVLKAWQCFAEGYGEYPLDIQFQYYGPMHDGPVWPLTLKQTMSSLPRSWKPDNFYPAGDSVGEAMKHFDLGELTAQTALMSRKWHEGWTSLQEAAGSAGNELEFTLAEALDVQFRSGANILRFYALRNALMDRSADQQEEIRCFVEKMRSIVQEEIGNSRRLAELCKLDPRLGYHSEAEVYKYYPAKLEWRARCLEQLLAEDFPALEAVLAAGEAPGTFITDATPAIRQGEETGANGIRWSVRADAEFLIFDVRVDGYLDCPENLFLHVRDRKGESKPVNPIVIDKTPEMAVPGGWHTVYRFPRERINYADRFYFGIERATYPAGKEMTICASKPGKYPFDNRLALGYVSPEELLPVQL